MEGIFVFCGHVKPLNSNRTITRRLSTRTSVYTVVKRTHKNCLRSSAVPGGLFVSLTTKSSCSLCPVQKLTITTYNGVPSENSPTLFIIKILKYHQKKISKPWIHTSVSSRLGREEQA